MKNVLSVPAKFPVQPKADLKNEKEVKAKKDDKIEDLMRNKIVEWVKNGDGGDEFFAKQKDAYPDYIPLYHVSTVFIHVLALILNIFTFSQVNVF